MNRREWAVVTVVSLLFALAIGVSNGEGNQGVYLLDGLRRADPTFLRGDWFTWDVEQNHVPFNLLVAGIASLGILEFGLTAGALLQSFGLAVAIYIAVKALYERPLRVWATTLVILAALRVPGVEGYGLIFPQFEAAVVAAVAAALGMALLLGSHLWVAGFLFGIAGLMHAHYAVLLIPVLGGVVLFERGGDRWRTAVRLCSPFLLVAAPTLMRAFRFAQQPSPQDWHEISLLHFPFHLLPSSWPVARWTMFFGAMALGVAGLLVLSPTTNRRFRGAAVTVFVLVVGSLPLGWSGSIPIVTTLWPWRLAPYLVIGFVAMFCAGAWSIARIREQSPMRIGMTAAAVLIGTTLITHHLTLTQLQTVFLVSLVPAAAAFRSDHRVSWPAWLPATVTTAVILLAFVPTLLISKRNWNSGIRPSRTRMIPLYDWIVDATPDGSLFVVPPKGMADFRLVTHRPIVWDWPSVMWPAEAKKQWYDRFLDVTGLDGPVDKVGAEAGYAAMDCSRIERLRDKYGAHYAVFKGPMEIPGDCVEIVYTDDHYRVFRIESSGGDGRAPTP